MRRSTFLGLLTATTLLGAYLRWTDLGGPSLWLDEILHLRAIESLAGQPWSQYFLGFRGTEAGVENGAFYYLLQMWGQRLAPGDVGVRLFPALIGTLSLPLMGWLGFRLEGPRLALVATFLLAVSPLHVYYSREGRPYALLMALSLVLLGALVLRRERAGPRMAVVACLLAAYVGLHAVPTLLSFGALASLALLWEWRDRRRWTRSPLVVYLVVTSIALGLIYGLYLSRTHVNTPVVLQTDATEERVAPPAQTFESPLTEESLSRLLASLTTSGHPENRPSLRSWALLAVSVVGLVAFLRRHFREAVLVGGMFVLIACLSLAALVSTERWYAMGYTGASLPAFVLLTALGLTTLGESLARGLARVRKRFGRRTAGVGWLTLGLVLLLAAPNLDAARRDPHRKVDWRGLSETLASLALEGESVIVPNPWPQVCLEHYFDQLGRSVEFHHVWESSQRAQKIVDSTPHGWLVSAGYRKSEDFRTWMRRFAPITQRRREGVKIAFYPDRDTLLKSRFAAGRRGVFEQRFADLGQRLEFTADEALLQGRGWSAPETNRKGVTFQWAMGEEALLALPLETPRNITLRFRVLPFVDRNAPPQRLELWLGETRLAERELPNRWSEQTVGVAASAWSADDPFLVLRFGRSTTAGVRRSSPDGRRLSVAFDYLEVVDAQGTASSDR